MELDKREKDDGKEICNLMKCEYLLFDFVIVAGPLMLSFDRRVHYVSRWPLVLLASTIVMIPYIVWDISVVGRHWWFNEQYTLNIRIAGLPIEEWLFFLVLPFASLFVWEYICSHRPGNSVESLRYVEALFWLGIPVGVLALMGGKTYTGLALMALALAALADRGFRTDLLTQTRTYLHLAILTGCLLLFDGYITARPVVLYSETHRLGLRVGTIPVEDFVYGTSLVLLNTVVYEWLKKVRGK